MNKPERQQDELGGGRCTASVERLKFRKCRVAPGRRGQPSSDPRCRSDATDRGRQCWSMQGLANMANTSVSGSMLMQEATAGGEVQQSQADKKRTRTAHGKPAIDSRVRSHFSLDYTAFSTL